MEMGAMIKSGRTISTQMDTQIYRQLEQNGNLPRNKWNEVIFIHEKFIV